MELVDASKMFFREKVGGIVLGCVGGLCYKFGNYKLNFACNSYVYEFLLVLASKEFICAIHMCASSARNLKSKWCLSVLVFESCDLGWES